MQIIFIQVPDFPLLFSGNDVCNDFSLNKSIIIRFLKLFIVEMLTTLPLFQTSYLQNLIYLKPISHLDTDSSIIEVRLSNV